MKRLFITAGAIAFFGALPALAVTTSEVLKDFQDQGFTNIEITQGPTQIKVEASNGDGTDKIEVIIDAASGDILKTETEQGDGGDVSDGTDISTTLEDFTHSHSSASDDDHDDSSSEADDDDDGDHGDDDHGDDDHGGDDDGGDDHGDDHGDD